MRAAQSVDLFDGEVVHEPLALPLAAELMKALLLSTSYQSPMWREPSGRSASPAQPL